MGESVALIAFATLALNRRFHHLSVAKRSAATATLTPVKSAKGVSVVRTAFAT